MNAMRTLLRSLSMIFALAALTACGGGGGSGGGGGGGANEPPKAISLNVTANKTQLPANHGTSGVTVHDAGDGSRHPFRWLRGAKRYVGHP